MDRAKKALVAAIPVPSYLVKQVPIWKYSQREWNSEEFKTQTANLFDELNVNYGWTQEKNEHSLEEAYHAYKKDKKDKMREYISESMVFENRIAMIEYVHPMVENVMANSKTLRKEKKCPEELVKDVNTLIYLADILSIPAFQRVKHQLSFKYGEKYIEKVVDKKKDVDAKVLEFLDYKPDSKAVKEKAKEYQAVCKKRMKEEAKAKEAPKEEPKKKSKKSKKSKKESDDDSGSDDDESGSDSEEEKKKKKKKKKGDKKDKKKKGSDSESGSDDESEEEVKKEKKEKKVKKEKKKVNSDSEEEEEEEEKKKEEPVAEEKKEDEAPAAEEKTEEPPVSA